MVYVIVSRLRKHKFTVKFGSSQLILYFCDTFVQESLDGAELHGQRAVIPGRSLLRVQTPERAAYKLSTTNRNIPHL